MRLSHGEAEWWQRFRSVRAFPVALLAALTIALPLSAAPAGAVIARIGGHAYGVTPVRGVDAASLPSVKRALRAAGIPATGPRQYDKAGQLVYHGGPVMHSVTSHVIFWDPNGEFTSTTKEIFHTFFSDVAHDSGSASNVFGVAGQYTDSTGNAAYSSAAAPEKVDTHVYPTIENCTTPTGEFADPGPYSTCLFDSQVQSELSTYVENEKLPTGPTELYFMILPHKVVSCFEEEDPEIEELACSNNVFCAYHSSINEKTPDELLYANIPFSLLDKAHAKGCQSDGNLQTQLPNGDGTGAVDSTRFADVALKYTSHEYIEAATDPLGSAWWDGHFQEIGDKCNFTGSGTGGDAKAFTPTLGGEAGVGNLFNQLINGGHFYLQSEWDNAGAACLMKPLALNFAAFTPSPASQTEGNPIEFSAAVADPYGQPGYTWRFGDGGTGTGSSVSHTYVAPGVYTVTMTSKDQLTGSTAPPVEHIVTVTAPPTAATPPTTTLPPVTPSTLISSPSAAAAITPNNTFNPFHGTFNAKTGVITLTGAVGDPGTFSWLLTFQNGKFGVFAASSAKCKKGFVRLKGKCRPSTIAFARGSKAVPGPGAVPFTAKPTASALKALKNALKQKKGLPVSIRLTFQSSRGGSAVSHTQSLTVRLKTK
ncbi:MAG: hypothetical protein QOI89_2801 [Solirubrobacteraceae bacterium]|nr:hypothetical protein [Solirubrobacteraceae bacterium]